MKDWLETHDEENKRWLVDKEQGRVDIKILPYLKDIKDGFFVEAGALDGLFMSNTKLLEDLGWHGLLIDPSRRAIEQCRKNRKCLIEECALVSRDFKDDKVAGDFIFDGESGVGAWSSINRQAYGYQNGKDFYPLATYVPARTLRDVLAEHEIKKVDFLSLDVEGYEMEVIKGIDFGAVEITFILVEVNTRDYTLAEMNYLLGSVGYKNLGCLSNFTSEMEGWDGSHQDYLFQRNG